MKSGTKTVLACAVVFAVSFALTGLVMGVGEGAAEPYALSGPADVTQAAVTAGTTVSAGAAADAVSAGADAISETDKTPEGGYILRVYEGNVAVFYGDFQTVPAIETNISAEDLRSADRKLLESGIRVPAYEDVVKLLEDFNS